MNKFSIKFKKIKIILKLLILIINLDKNNEIKFENID